MPQATRTDKRANGWHESDRSCSGHCVRAFSACHVPQLVSKLYAKEAKEHAVDDPLCVAGSEAKSAWIVVSGHVSAAQLQKEKC